MVIYAVHYCYGHTNCNITSRYSTYVYVDIRSSNGTSIPRSIYVGLS